MKRPRDIAQPDPLDAVAGGAEVSAEHYHLSVAVDEYRLDVENVRRWGGVSVATKVHSTEVTLETETFVIDSSGETFDKAAADALRCLADAIEHGKREHGMARVIEIKRREPGESRKI